MKALRELLAWTALAQAELSVRHAQHAYDRARHELDRSLARRDALVAGARIEQTEVPRQPPSFLLLARNAPVVQMKRGKR